MYKAFKLFGNNIVNDYDDEELKKYKTAGESLYKKYQCEIKTNLKKFQKPNGELDGKKMTAEWFPIVNADIFISHSHKDLETVLLLSGFLYLELGIECFIDSCIWGYADDLLRAIDNDYCLKPSGCYSYEKRNFSTSHVHMMLSIAITKMIYNTECLLFLNTPNSIYPKDVIPGESLEEETLSPWIHTELEMTKLIQKRSVSEHRSIQKAFSEAKEDLKLLHSADTSHMEEIKYDQLYNWAGLSFSNKFEALNYLYQINDDDTKHIYG